MKKKYIIDNIEFDSDVEMVKFREIFDHIGSFVLEYNDQNLEWAIYEDYDDFQCGTLLDFKLDILLDSELLSENIVQKAKEMRNLTEKILGENVERSANIIRNSSDWQHIISLADEIRIFLNK